VVWYGVGDWNWGRWGPGVLDVVGWKAGGRGCERKRGLQKAELAANALKMS